MVRTLQLVTTRRPFFEQQVRVLERNGVSCTVVPVPGGGDEQRTVAEYARFYARALRTVAVEEFDLVHANYGLTAPAALAQPTRPIVLSLWGSDLLGRFGPLSAACADLFDAVVVMSEEMSDALDGPCRVVPHGVDTERFAPAPRREAQDEVGWDPDSRHVFFPYDPSRDVKDYPRAERVVASADDAVDERVELHAVHGVDHERVPAYMNAADALLLTSKREGSPNAVKEALACDLPVVATAVGGVPTLLQDVDGGVACRSDDELVDGLVDVLTSRSGAGAREVVERFSLERMGRDLLSVYDSVLDRPVEGSRERAVIASE